MKNKNKFYKMLLRERTWNKKKKTNMSDEGKRLNCTAKVFIKK